MRRKRVPSFSIGLRLEKVHPRRDFRETSDQTRFFRKFLRRAFSRSVEPASLQARRQGALHIPLPTIPHHQAPFGFQPQTTASRQKDLRVRFSETVGLGHEYCLKPMPQSQPFELTPLEIRAAVGQQRQAHSAPQCIQDRLHILVQAPSLLQAGHKIPCQFCGSRETLPRFFPQGQNPGLFQNRLGSIVTLGVVPPNPLLPSMTFVDAPQFFPIPSKAFSLTPVPENVPGLSYGPRVVQEGRVEVEKHRLEKTPSKIPVPRVSLDGPFQGFSVSADEKDKSTLSSFLRRSKASRNPSAAWVLGTSNSILRE